MSPRLTCLIAAWNEAARLPAVLDAVRDHPLIDRLLVVDDGSTDDTALVAERAGAEVLRLTANGGKTAALAAGIARLEGEHVLLLDADLTGLRAGDVTALATPVLGGRAEATLSLRGNTPRLWRWLGVDYISGERVLSVDLLKSLAPALPGLPRFGFEVFLNQALRTQGHRVAVVGWPGVASPSKASKQGVWRGLWADLRMIRDILRCQPLPVILGQILWLRDQIARQNRACSASAAVVSPTTRPSQMPTPPRSVRKPSAYPAGRPTSQ